MSNPLGLGPSPLFKWYQLTGERMMNRIYFVQNADGDKIVLSCVAPKTSICAGDTNELAKIYDKNDLLTLLSSFNENQVRRKKPSEVMLYKWRLYCKDIDGPLSDVFVVDRGDKKRRSTSELKTILYRLSGVTPRRGVIIVGYDCFWGFPASYGVKE